MRVLVSIVSLVACSPTPAEPPQTGTPPTPPRPDAVSDAAPADRTPVGRWRLEVHSQFFGTALGPLKSVAITSDGAITVKADARVLAAATLGASDLETLARFVADPKLTAAVSVSDGDMGPTGGLVVTGDVALRLRWGNAPPPEVLPLLREVYRLRALVAPPENFRITVTTQGHGVVPGPLDEVRLSSNGYVETLRDGTRLSDHTLPAVSLAPLQALLADPALRKATSSEAPGEGVMTTFVMTGDLALELRFMHDVTGAAGPVVAEVLRLGAAVRAKRDPPASFTVVYTRTDGADAAPHRVTLGSDGRVRVEEPGQPPKEGTLVPEVIPGFAQMLVDPGLRTAAPGVPSGPGKRYEVRVSGDVAFAMTYVGEMPQTVIALLNRIDWLASRAAP